MEVDPVGPEIDVFLVAEVTLAPLLAFFLPLLFLLASEKFCNWIIMRRSVNLRSE